MMVQDRPPTRRGMVLIELVGVIAVMTIVLATVTALFATIFRLDRSLGASSAVELELQRLAAYFRRDAHSAEGLDMSANGNAWSFPLADGTRVDYRVLADSVQRVVRAQQDGDATDTQRQELSVPAAAEVRIEEVRFAGQPMVRLTIASSDEGQQFASAPVVIEVALGRWSGRHFGSIESEGAR